MPVMQTSDRFGIVANVISDKVLRTGAKVWVCYCNGDASCPRVMGLAKGGNWCEKYTHFKRLENFRAKWIPEHLRAPAYKGYGVCWQYETKDEAARHANSLNEMWKGVRFFHSNGKLLQDGITEGEAFKRANKRWSESRRWFACHKCGFEHEFDGVGMKPVCSDCGAWLNLHTDADGELPKRLPPVRIAG
jgi:hypothetical protein